MKDTILNFIENPEMFFYYIYVNYKKVKNIGEELNIEPRLRPAKTGSVSQNTSKPIKPRKNNKKFATLMSPTTSSVA